MQNPHLQIAPALVSDILPLPYLFYFLINCRVCCCRAYLLSVVVGDAPVCFRLGRFPFEVAFGLG